MTTTAVRPKGAHLVGSVPLESSEQVFRTAAATLGAHLERIPDGETGERTTWIAWQGPHLAAHPQFEVEEPPPGQYAPLRRVRLRPGVAADDVSFDGGLGYAAAARDSYQTFARLLEDGVIPAHMRFQVSLPTPLAPVCQFISHRDQAAVEPAYERQMIRELQEICEPIPEERLAVQWDVAIEMGMWEGLDGLFQPWFEPVREGIIDRLARCAEATPSPVQMGFHLCYGDFGHEHFTQPADAANLTEVANRLAERIGRPIDWIHLPVPHNRDDAAFFRPLADLRLHPDTKLFLGLVHLHDGIEGAHRRIAAAREAVSEFGVATECGFGRRPADTVTPLMELHSRLAEPAV
jgi:hypothetical protein